jgi:hypothetical protein
MLKISRLQRISVIKFLRRFPGTRMQPLTAHSENIEGPTPKTRRVEVLRVKKLSEHATLPVRSSAGAAGYDLARYATTGWRSLGV